MNLEDYFDSHIVPIRLDNLPDFSDKYSHYPVINAQNQLIATISEEDLFHLDSVKQKVDILFVIDIKKHPIECLCQMIDGESNVLFVIDSDGCYVGAISYESILDYFYRQLHFSSGSSIIELRSKIANYSLTELSRIIESEGMQIQNLFVSPQYVSSEMDITLTVSHNNLQSVLGVLENKGYEVIQVYNEVGVQNHYKERYDHLMMYLNI